MRDLLAIAGLLLALAIVNCLAIGLLYWEEDARGARAWAATQADIRKRGEPLEYSALVPPRIPDDQNLGAIPLFKVERVGSPSDLEAVALKKALEDIDPSEIRGSLAGNRSKGEPADMAAITKYLTGCYRTKFGDAKPAPLPLATMDFLCPALKDLRQASASRPEVRFEEDYTSQPPYARPFTMATKLLQLPKVINLHAIVALHQHQPEVALDDALLSLKLASGLSREPLLISGLISCAMVSIQFGSIWEGLSRHAWSDAQLAQLQGQFQQADYLSDYQLCLRGEGCGFFASNSDYLRDHPQMWTRLLLGLDSESALPSTYSFGRLLLILIPGGWYDLSKAQGVASDYQAARYADPKNHRAYADLLRNLDRKIKRLSPADPPNLLVRIAVPAVIGALENFTKTQVNVDMAYIACALERYRLAHGAYPSTLEGLDAYAPSALPHDPLTGASYHYKLLPAGNYQLYSVGWNLKDDGGTVVYLQGSNFPDKDQGDWVWTSLQEKVAR